jgi:hypothetical protein
MLFVPPMGHFNLSHIILPPSKRTPEEISQFLRCADVSLARRHSSAPFAENFAVSNQLLIFLEVFSDKTDVLKETEMFLMIRMGHLHFGHIGILLSESSTPLPAL